MAETSGLITVSTKLGRIAKLAREMPQAALTTLAHHIDIDWLREAYRRTRKDGATGVDRQTAYEYAKNLAAGSSERLPRHLKTSGSAASCAPRAAANRMRRSAFSRFADLSLPKCRAQVVRRKRGFHCRVRRYQGLELVRS